MACWLRLPWFSWRSWSGAACRAARSARAASQTEAEPEWAPDAGEALALLEDADWLAAEGRYDEATHLLLKRSVGQIAAARPDLLEPRAPPARSLVLPALSEAARGAFALIAGRVERSLFALRGLSVDDWDGGTRRLRRLRARRPPERPGVSHGCLLSNT